MTVPCRLQASILVAGCLLSAPGWAQPVQKPQIFIAATGGTIAGVQKNVEQHGYTAGELGVAALVEAVPQLKDIADVRGESVKSWGLRQIRGGSVESSSSLDGR